MSVETTTTTSTSGSTTTVGATVREGAGGPGGSRKVDVYLLIEPAKMWYDASKPPSPTPTRHDHIRLAAYWKDLTFTEKSPLNLTYTVIRKPNEDHEGSVEGTVIVCDRTNLVLDVKRFSLCCPSRTSKWPLDIGTKFDALTKKSTSKKSTAKKSKKVRKARPSR